MINIKNKQFILKGFVILIVLISLIVFLQFMKNGYIKEPKSYFIKYDQIIYSNWDAYEFYRNNPNKDWRYMYIQKSGLTGKETIKEFHHEINFLECFNKIKKIKDTISIKDMELNKIDAYCVRKNSMDMVSLKGIMF